MRGRKQYRYHVRWREVRDETKYSRLADFGDKLPAIRLRVEADLALPGLPREKVLATVVRLLRITGARIGNQEYARENNSFGLTTLRDKHAFVRGPHLERVRIHQSRYGECRMSQPFMLFRKNRKLFIRFCGQDHDIAVSPVWTRPLTARGRELSLVDQNKREVMRVPDPDSLDPESRDMLISELESRYLIPLILKIVDVRAHLGTLYWTVITDAGPRRFALKDPSENVMWLSEDHIVLRDCVGNRYEIESIRGMDRQSRNKMSLVI